MAAAIPAAVAAAAVARDQSKGRRRESTSSCFCSSIATLEWLTFQLSAFYTPNIQESVSIYFVVEEKEEEKKQRKAKARSSEWGLVEESI